MGEHRPEFPDLEPQRKPFRWPSASDWIGGVCLFASIYITLLFAPILF
jgi:hypothetical protein